MTGSDGNDAIAGGSARHIPVMLDEVMAALEPRSGSVFIDGTFGAGGYSRALLEAGAKVIGIDRDPRAIAGGQPLLGGMVGRLMLVEGRFGELDRIAARLGHPHVEGVVLDIGVSSMQVDEAARGFSFLQDGPLDMRMEREGPTAADVVNQAAPTDLTRIIGLLGEERAAARLSRAICDRRNDRPFLRTGDLAALAERTLGRKPGARIHPATRLFQALRIFVNRELEQLRDALLAAERVLSAGGRLAVVTFHSLEDRIVKRFFADRAGARTGSRHLPESAARAPTFRIAGRGVAAPSESEIAKNPRARSAHLRHGVRTQEPARPDFSGFFEAHRLPDVATFGGAGN
jgi:16S rRNA (cytosine1402-N4)-methyltransferase